MNYRDDAEQNCRLVLLRLLSEQPDGTLNDAVLHKSAETFGHRRSRDYIKSQIRWLADVGAVKVVEPQGVLVVTLTTRGEDHVERRAFIDAVSKPSPPSA